MTLAVLLVLSGLTLWFLASGSRPGLGRGLLHGIAFALVAWGLVAGVGTLVS